ncbi:molybdopterin molybdotransferase MoeA [Spelaeicoccus albus]|nr:molybdopterin-binding protein [Spelaeicoccus albus]
MTVDTHAGASVEFDDARSSAYRLGTAGAADSLRTIPVDGRPDPVRYVLARRTVAAGRVPSADVAAMDGFAVAGPSPWTLVGTSLAGDDPEVPQLEPGQACLIATGAVVPAGTDAVVRHEDIDGDWPPTGTVVNPRGTPRRRNIRRAGEEIEPGSAIGEPGDPVHAALRGLAAAAGLDELCVRQPPRMALIATGTELTSSGPAAPGRVRDSITPILRQLVPGAGAEVISAERVPDDADLLAERLGAAIDSADVVVTSGMASRGPTDHVRSVLAGLGARPVVSGVRVRPGGPASLALFGRGSGSVPVVSLPGNPLAAVVGFHTLVLPLVRGLVGAALPALAAAVLHGAPEPHPHSSTVVPVEFDDDGRLSPTGWHRSAQLRGLARQGLLAVLAPAGRESGATVRLLRQD